MDAFCNNIATVYVCMCSSILYVCAILPISSKRYNLNVARRRYMHIPDLSQDVALFPVIQKLYVHVYAGGASPLTSVPMAYLSYKYGRCEPEVCVGKNVLVPNHHHLNALL